MKHEVTSLATLEEWCADHLKTDPALVKITEIVYDPNTSLLDMKVEVRQPEMIELVVLIEDLT